MNVYIDVLLVFNFYIDYVLLYTNGKLCKIKTKPSKLLISSLIGAFSSLYILLPMNSQLGGFIYSAIISLLLSIIAYGKQHLIKCTAVLYILNCLFNGICLLIWSLSKDNRIIINNNIVYFDLSPIVLIISTAVIYFAVGIFKRYFGYKNAQSSCKVTIYYDNFSATVNCLIDSGNLLKDIYTEKPIIIIEKEIGYSLLNIKNLNINQLYNLNGFRLIPIKSINGDGMLISFKADRIVADIDRKEVEIDGYIAISENNLSNGYQGIIGAYALSLGEELIYA